MRRCSLLVFASAPLALQPASAQTMPDRATAPIRSPGIGLYSFAGSTGLGDLDRAPMMATPVPTAPSEASPAIQRAGDTISGNMLHVGPFLLNTTFAAVRTPNVSAIAANGNAISYCSIDGCVYLDGQNAGAASSLDHQRATALFSSITSDDGHSQENTLGVETTIATGAKTTWAANTSYAAHANVIVGSSNNVYRAEGVCKSGSVGPAGYASAIADGSCSWDWINTGALDAKVGFYNAVRVKQGAGPAWGSSENVVVEAGPLQNGVTQKEMDLINLGPPASVGSPILLGLNIGLGGNTATAGLEIGAAGSSRSDPGALFGAWFTGAQLASIATVEDDTSAPVGISFGNLAATTHSKATIQDNSTGRVHDLVTGNHTSSTWEDVSTSPVSVSIGGTHTTAAFEDSSRSKAGIVLDGTYVDAQIIGEGISHDPRGNLNVSAATASTSTSTGAIITAGGIGLQGALNVGGTERVDGLLMASGAAAVDGRAGTTALQVTGVGSSPARLSIDFVGGGSNYIDGGNLFVRSAGGAANFAEFGAAGLNLSAGLFQEVLRTPASSSAACDPGQFTDDEDYHYVCTRKNKWKRVALSDF